MEPSQCFEYLIVKTQKLPILNDTQREIILTDLKYFLSQSLSDQDRRHHLGVLQNRWKAFEMKVVRTPLLNEPKGFFHPIQEFLGKPKVIFEDSNEIIRMNKWDIHEFLQDLLKEYDLRKEFLDATEDNLVFCGLRFLLSEAKLSSSQQDRKAIQKTWKSVRPILEKYGFFYRYVGAKALSTRLRLFLTGSI